MGLGLGMAVTRRQHIHALLMLVSGMNLWTLKTMGVQPRFVGLSLEVTDACSCLVPAVMFATH